MNDRVSGRGLPIESRMPAFTGATGWLNSPPLTPDSLRGKVVAVQFWTFTCINWLRTLPYVRSWVQTYGKHGLVVIGVHTPEFGAEHDTARVSGAAGEMGIEYPVVIDNDYAIWDAFANRYWPALYLADDAGRIRYHHFGEGGYEQTEQAIRQLLADSGAGPLPEPAAKVVPRGIEVAADWEQLKSPETYLGLRRSAGFASPQTPLLGRAVEYSLPQRLELNQWALGGSWTIGQEAAVNNRTGGRLVHRFHARDLNLILSPPPGGSAGFRIGIDGKPPENDHGIDVDSKGDGVVDEVRLYQLIRQSGPINDRRFEIEFSDAGVGALCFTFG